MTLTKIHIVLLILIPIFCLILSCSYNVENNPNLTADAVLTWTGEYEVDGCGFFIIINEHKYKSENESIIDDSYKISGETTVKVEYEILNKTIESWCGDLPYTTKTDGIKIISIRKI